MANSYHGGSTIGNGSFYGRQNSNSSTHSNSNSLYKYG